MTDRPPILARNSIARTARAALPVCLMLAGAATARPAIGQEVRTEVLGEAERLREQARDADAHKRAPMTYEYADSLYNEAGILLESEPPRIEEARELGKAAALGFAHAQRLAPLADSIRNRKVSGEEILLRREAYLAALSEALALSPRFTEGIEAVAAFTLEEAVALQAEHRRLVQTLDERTAEVAVLAARLDTAEARLVDLERREAEAAAELRRRQDTERRLREVRAVFDPEEAEVLVTDDRVTIRLTGLTFASGSAELGSGNSQLLTKLERVVREFPGSRITVEGHTDNVGEDAANQALSQRRAIAVRDYLLAGIAMSADRISAVGFGKARPIAPNETAEGRRLNRRIDVTIDPGG
jgi:outer membrane protein OmpA-like peptidoglycan-associated protein